MEWPVVQKRIRKIWKKIAKHVPERTKRAKGQLDYEDEQVFEAALYMVRHNIAMRDLEEERYPSPNPLYLRLAAMVRSRVLDMAWASFLKDTSRAELEDWAAAFDGIRRHRRRPSKGKVPRPRVKDGKKLLKPERTGLSSGLAWIEILRRGLEDICVDRGIDLDISRERA